MEFFYFDIDIVTIFGTLLNVVCYGAIAFLVCHYVKKSKAKKDNKKGRD